MQLNIPSRGNPKLAAIVKVVRSDIRLQTLLECSNIMAIDRMGLNDHGPTHVTIVSNIALKLLRNLISSGITPSIVKDHSMSDRDAEVVVVLASLLHDLGHVVHRKDHPRFSIPLALPIIREYLAPHYDERERTIMTSEILHCIIAHDTSFPAISVEAGVVRLADALDMEKGRARIPFKEGSVSIHSVSALSIEDVKISRGEMPIEVNITMSNSAGIYQIDELLRKKLEGSGLEGYVKVMAHIDGEEKKILQDFDIGSK